MRSLKHKLWLTVLVPMLALAGQDAQIQPGIRPAPTPDIDMEALVQLHEEIASAPDGTIFNVEAMFDEPVKLGELRRVATELQILRATAEVEFGPYYRGNNRQSTFVHVGALYNEPGSWEREICRPMMIALNMPNAYPLDQPAGEWPVSEVRVLGPAEALRSLLAGESLPPVVILEGWREDPRNMDVFIDAIKRQHAEKIQVQDSDTVPEECRTFTNRILAPVLTGTPAIQPAEYGNNHNPDFLAVIRDHLATRSSETPVTLQVTLEVPSAVDVFAALVDDYDIDGLSAEMAPEDPTVRIISGAELSIHGGPIDDQIVLFDCGIRLGRSNDYKGRWVGRHAEVSTSVSKAWNLVGDQRLIDARLLNEYELGSLELIKMYYEARRTSGLTLPASIAIPSGCEPYLNHGN